MSRISVVLVACVAIAASGCKKHGGGAGTGGGKGGDRVAVDPVPGTVQLLVDGKVVGSADAAAAQKWSRVADLMPAAAKDPKAWQVLEIHTATGRVTTMPEPASTQPGLVAALFPGKDGVDFGMFAADDLAKRGSPKLIEMNVTDVRVKLAAGAAGSGSGSGSGSGTGSGGSGGGDGEGNGSNRIAGGGGGTNLSALTLTIKQKSVADVTITGDDLAKIPKVAPPTGDTDTTGWDVAAVLASRNIKPTAKVIITDDSGTSVTMTSAQFDPKKDLAFMKLNKQGQVRFRLFEKNPSGVWDVVGELRGVTTIELLP